MSDSEYGLELKFSMGIDTQHQHSRNSDTPEDQGEVNHQSQDGAQKPDQVANSEGEHVDIESVSVVQGKKRKSVPVYRLFQYSNIWDIFMIIVGTVMAIAAGLGIPGHIILLGFILNQFVRHSIVVSNNLDILIDSQRGNETCATYQVQLRYNPQVLTNIIINQGSSPTATGSGYFCSNSSSGSDILSDLLDYICDPDDALRKRIGLFSLYYVFLATGILAAVLLATMFWNLSADRQIQRLRRALYHSILRQEIGWFDSVETGMLSTSLVDDVEKIHLGIGDKVAVFLQFFTTFIACFVIAFVTNWRLALVVSVALPALILIGMLLTKIVASFSVREQMAYASAGSIAEEVLSAIRTVVAFGGEEKEAARYGEKLKLTRNEGYKKSFFSNLVLGAVYFVILSTYALSLWYGSVLILGCELYAGDVVIVFLSVINGSFTLGNALPKLEAFATALGSATVVFEIIDREPLIDWSADEGETPNHLDGNIKFSNVKFAYPTRPDIQILNGLDLEIKAGKTVALVGPSGCGKSTTVQLIQRFYNPLSGQITIDGREISLYNLQWLRGHIGVVSQEPVLFNTSIAENIRFGCKDATMKDVIQVARNSNAHDFISKMTDGYNTQVGQRGAQLSGGQKQRIAIARVLLRDPKILLLDEATSALDNQNEKIVQEALNKARRGRTTIVIAHKLSTIQTADVIVAISGGKVVEIGNHRQLMEKEGLYYELVTAQEVYEEEDHKLSRPISRFRKAVNKSIAHRRKMLAGFRDAVEQSMALHRKEKSPSPNKYHNQANSSPSRNIFSRRLSSQIELATLTAGSVAAQAAYVSEVDDLNIVAEVDMEGDDGNLSKQSVSDDLKHASVRTLLVEFVKLNQPDWLFILVGVVCSALIGCLLPLISVPFSEVLRLYGLNDPESIKIGIARVCGGFIAAAVGAFLFYFTANFSLSVAGERLTERLRYLSFKAMLRQDMSWFDRKTNSTGALLTRLASDTASIKAATGITFGTIVQALCSLLAGIIIAFTSTWELALLLLVAFPVLASTNYFHISLLTGRAKDNKRRMEESGQTAMETVDNIHTVASLGLQSHFCSKYIGLLKGPLRTYIKSVLVQALMLAVGQALVYYVYAAGYFLSTQLIIEERTTYDRAFRVFSAVHFTALSISQVSSIAPDLTKAKVSAIRILTLLKRKPQIDASCSNGIILDKVSGNFATDSVYFSYPSCSNIRVLQGLTVSVKPGQTLALVGPSGCGKSTLISLVERFYNPTDGQVTLEGTDIKSLNLSWLRQQIGIVPQEPVLFDISIAENIRYGALYRDVLDEEMVAAAKLANIHNFIESLPLGYATNVGSKGTQLSGGQKQRIAIARALVRNPKILLLDEATSALDTESEKVVQEALNIARRGRTSIVIAHRLSTIYNSDVIAVIHEGQVIESGTHARLMGLREAYYHLNTAQQETYSQ